MDLIAETKVSDVFQLKIFRLFSVALPKHLANDFVAET